MAEDPIPKRTWLRHEVPDWLDNNDALFAITVNTIPRGRNSLCTQEHSQQVLEAARFYGDQHKWHIELFLLMPDHFHAILGFPNNEGIAQTVGFWKRYLTKQLDINWQAGCFDHRLRSPDAFVEKAHYILMNPVRAGLCKSPKDWPHRLGSDRVLAIAD